MKRFAFFVSLSICMNALARGGSDVGNGGVTVECFRADGSFINSVILDHLEADLLYGLKADLGPAHTSFESQLEVAFERIERLNPVRANRYRKAIQGWALKDIIFQDEPMDLQSDTVPSFVPKNCSLRQIAIRKRVAQSISWSESVYYNFSQHLNIYRPAWNRLSNLEKSILILHELLYWETSIAGQSLGSLPARQLNAIVFSGKIDQLQINEWIQIARSYNLPDVEFKGLSIDPHQIFLSQGQLVKVKAGKFERAIGEVEIQGQRIEVLDFVKFHPDGSVLSTYSENIRKIKFKTVRGDLVVKGLLHFNQDGIVTGFSNIDSRSLIRLGATSIQCGDAPGAHIENASLNFETSHLTCWAKAGTKLELPEAQFLVVKEGRVLLTDEGIDWNSGKMNRRLAELKGRMRMKTLNGTLILSTASQVESNQLWRGELVRPTQIRVTDYSFEIKNTVFVDDSYYSPLGSQSRLFVRGAEPTNQLKYYGYLVSNQSDRCSGGRILIEVDPRFHQDFPHGYIKKFAAAQAFWQRNSDSHKFFKVKKGGTVLMSPAGGKKFEIFEVPSCIKDDLL